MAKNVDRPIIFPLSNPTTSAECTAKEAYEWSDGRCVFASGSPFDEVEYNGKTFTPTQCNNMFIFPGIGLGATLSGAKTITDRMLYVSACALAEFLTDDDLEKGKVFPKVSFRAAPQPNTYQARQRSHFRFKDNLNLLLFHSPGPPF